MKNGHYKCVQLLLDKGVYYNDFTFETEDEDVCRLLISKGFDMNKTDQSNSLKPIQRAIRRNDLNIVKRFISLGAKIDTLFDSRNIR